MLMTSCQGPTLAQLRPLKPDEVSPDSGQGRFPVYPDLVDRMASHAVDHPDPAVAHALAVACNYAYASVAGFCEEPDTLARMMARVGMPGNRTLMIADRVEAAFIISNGFVLQSEDGRVVLVVYRGTEPFNLANWLTDADIHSEQVTIGVGDQNFTVHPGFYRNLRATRSPIIAALDRARRGRSILDEDVAVDHPMQALYVTGHSLGGAMASLLGLLLLNDPAYAPLRPTLRNIYTYGAPMIGPDSLADAIADSGQDQRFLRFVYRRDVVPFLPPWGLGRYRHFGAEFRPNRDEDGWERADAPRAQAPFVSIPIALSELLARSLPLVRQLPFLYSMSDHLPLKYVEWLAPEGVVSEYGDYDAERLDAGSSVVDLRSRLRTSG